MVEHFRTRMEEGKSSPGVFLVSQFARTGEAVFQLRTATYQEALERGTAANREGNVTAQARWLAQFGEPTAG